MIHGKKLGKTISFPTANISITDSDKLIPKNAKIVAPYNGDTAFLYQTKRKGWASFSKPLPELIKMGAQYLILVNPTPEDYGIGKTYKVKSVTNDYILFDSP